MRVGNRRAAAFSAVVVTSLSLFVAAACTALVLCLRDRLSYLFTGGEAVARAVSDLCPFLAVTPVLSGEPRVPRRLLCNHYSALAAN